MTYQETDDEVMDSKMMFAHMYVAELFAQWNAQLHRPIPKDAVVLSSMLDRVMTYKRLIVAFGAPITLELYLHLLLAVKGDMHVKQELMEEFRLAWS